MTPPNIAPPDERWAEYARNLWISDLGRVANRWGLVEPLVRARYSVIKLPGTGKVIPVCRMVMEKFGPPVPVVKESEVYIRHLGPLDDNRLVMLEWKVVDISRQLDLYRSHAWTKIWKYRIEHPEHPEYREAVIAQKKLSRRGIRTKIMSSGNLEHLNPPLTIK